MNHERRSDLPSPLWERVAPNEVRRRVKGFVPQAPHHRPTVKRIRNFAKKIGESPPMLKRQCGGCSETDGSHVSNFVGKRPFKALFLISSATKSASSLKLMAASTNHPGVTREAVLIAEGFRIARYWNNDVLQRPSAVLEDIFAKLAEP
jgi:Protein of unknown function (DUF559)